MSGIGSLYTSVIIEIFSCNDKLKNNTMFRMPIDNQSLNVHQCINIHTYITHNKACFLKYIYKYVCVIIKK